MATTKDVCTSFRLVATLTGTTPLLVEAMTRETIEKVLIRRDRTPVNTEVSLEARAGRCLYANPDGSGIHGMPTSNLFACLIEAGRLIAYEGKRKISTASSSFLPSMLALQGEFLPFPPDMQAWVVDVRRGRLEQTGVAVGIVRPKFPQWAVMVTADIDLADTQLTEETFRSLFRRAGKAIGLGSFRPACRGNFGQFKITDWAWTENREV